MHTVYLFQKARKHSQFDLLQNLSFVYDKLSDDKQAGALPRAISVQLNNSAYVHRYLSFVEPDPWDVKVNGSSKKSRNIVRYRQISSDDDDDDLFLESEEPYSKILAQENMDMLGLAIKANQNSITFIVDETVDGNGISSNVIPLEVLRGNLKDTKVVAENSDDELGLNKKTKSSRGSNSSRRCTSSTDLSIQSQDSDDVIDLGHFLSHSDVVSTTSARNQGTTHMFDNDSTRKKQRRS